MYKKVKPVDSKLVETYQIFLISLFKAKSVLRHKYTTIKLPIANINTFSTRSWNQMTCWLTEHRNYNGTSDEIHIIHKVSSCVNPIGQIWRSKKK